MHHHVNQHWHVLVGWFCDKGSGLVKFEKIYYTKLYISGKSIYSEFNNFSQQKETKNNPTEGTRT